MKSVFAAVVAALAVATTVVSGAEVEFKSCGGVLTVEKIDGTTWPPAKGQHFSSTTYLSNPTGADAKFDGAWTIQTKWNGMNADSQSGNVCDGFGDVKCNAVVAPGGKLQIVNDGDFPSSAPAGTYVVRTELKDSQYNTLYCYTTTFKA